jgi:hypothetical protein
MKPQSFRSFRTLFALGIVLAGCSGQTGSPTDQAGENPPAQGDVPAPPPGPGPAASPAPNVIDSSPASGAKGVADNGVIRIMFDRAMDEASVAAAYSSADLPTEQVSFAWNASSTELVIKPNAPLAYAQGDKSIAAKGYAIAISTAAKDKAGTALQQPFALSFSTLRRITEKMPYTVPMTGRALSNGTFSALVVGVGDSFVNGNEMEGRTLMTFLVSSLPDNLTVEKATLQLDESDYQGTPDATFGQLGVHHVFFASGAEGFAAEPMAGAPTSRVLSLLPNVPTARRADVTAMVKEDLANRAVRFNRSQYRLVFASGPNGDNATDMVFFDKQSISLSVVYVTE